MTGIYSQHLLGKGMIHISGRIKKDRIVGNFITLLRMVHNFKYELIISGIFHLNIFGSQLTKATESELTDKEETTFLILSQMALSQQHKSK
jgi:hypothetical protein